MLRVIHDVIRFRLRSKLELGMKINNLKLAVRKKQSHINVLSAKVEFQDVLNSELQCDRANGVSFRKILDPFSHIEF